MNIRQKIKEELDSNIGNQRNTDTKYSLQNTNRISIQGARDMTKALNNFISTFDSIMQSEGLDLNSSQYQETYEYISKLENKILDMLD